jgi:hypothetical protein
MKEILRQIGTILRRARELMTSAATFAYEAVDGATSWIWSWVANRSRFDVGPDPYADEPMAMEAVQEPDLAPDEAALERLGSVVLKAAHEVLAHGAVRSGDVPPGVVAWLVNLERTDLWEIVRHDPIAVGRHTAGLTPLKGVAGEALRGPDADEDKKREKARQAALLERRNEAAAAARRRRQVEVVPEAGYRLPGLAA